MRALPRRLAWALRYIAIMDPQLLSILVCPRCKGPLRHRPELSALDCEACGLRFPIHDDIPVMLESEATALDQG